jgi:sugar (pentulose or hexulose) kinase
VTATEKCCNFTQKFHRGTKIDNVSLSQIRTSNYWTFLASRCNSWSMRSLAMVIGIDVGTSGVRATAADSHGSLVEESKAPLSACRDASRGVHEQNAAEWWRVLCGVLRELGEGLGDRGKRLAGISVTSTSGTLVVTDKLGSPLRPSIMYDDTRASEAATELNSISASSERWNHSHSLSKALWVRDTEPHVWERVRWLLHPADWLAGMLTGIFGVSDSSNSLKLGYRPDQGWSPTVARIGIPAQILPAVHSPGRIVGVLSGMVAHTVGLPPGVPILAGATDGLASLIASGARQAGDANTTLGTTVVWKVLATEKPACDGGIYSHLHPTGLWAPGAASNSGPGALLMKTAGSTFAEMDRLAAARLPTKTVCYMLPGTGERFPFLNPSAMSFVEGQPETEADWWAAQLQAIAFLERWGYETLRACGAPTIHQVYSAGGAARSDTLSQLRADILNREIVNPRYPSAAFGAAILAATGALYGNDCAAAIDAMVTIDKSFQPGVDKSTQYDEFYRLFRAACRQRGYY